MSALGRPVHGTHPGHLQLELLVLAILVRHVNDACSLLDPLLQTYAFLPGLGIKLQLLQLRLRRLTPFTRRRAVVTPVESGRFDHVEERTAFFHTLRLASGAHLWATAHRAVDADLGLGIPAADDGGDAEGAHGIVEGVGLHVGTHAVGEGGGGDGRFVGAPPAGGLIPRAAHEVAAIW